QVLHTGDALHFVIRPSIPAYLYIVLASSTGALQILFPSVRAAVKNPIAADATVVVPAPERGSLGPDDAVGPERPYLLLSERALPDLDRLTAPGQPPPSGPAIVGAIERTRCSASNAPGGSATTSLVDGCKNGKDRGLVLVATDGDGGESLTTLLRAKANDSLIV